MSRSSAPKTETIRQHCDSSLALAILAERGLVTEQEVGIINGRILGQRQEAYARIYGRAE